MNSGYPEVTKQDPSLTYEILIREESESLAKFDLELWAQHHRSANARRFPEKKLTEVLELVD